MKDYKQRSIHTFDQQAAQYDTKCYGDHARALYPLLMEQLGQIPRERVLDLGCGTGALLAQMSDRWPAGTYTGLDLSSEMVAVAKDRLSGRATVLQGDAEYLPFPDRSFQVVVCCDSFHHYPSPGRALEQIHRVLEPGGVFLLADATAPAGVRWLLNRLLPLGGGGDVRMYSPTELRALLSPLFHGAECRRVSATSLLAWGIR